MKKKKIVWFLAFTALVSGVLLFLNRLLMPKYMGDILEGAFIEEYYQETAGHDVIFIGDCEVYENFSPVILWYDYGIPSYIRGSAQQLIWQSYYLLEETLSYEKPKAVVFNVLSMKYGEPQKEAYNRMTLDGMRWSKQKVEAIRASMLAEEHMLDYLFPLLRYHSRWNELTREDFTYLFHKRKVTHNGYYMRVDVKPVDVIPEGKPLPNYQFSDTSYAYLERMTRLCKDNGIELILIKAPCIYPYWYPEWDKQIVEYAEKNGLTYLNFLERAEEIGIDFSTDTYDGGLHMNLSGAEKLTDYMGKILSEEFQLPDRRGEPELSKVWDEKIEFYNNMIDAQYKELEEYGYLKSFGGSPDDRE